MVTYSFKVVVEPDDDRWHAYCPALHEYGAATWGYTEHEAYQNIQQVVQLVVAELLEEGTPLPESPPQDVQVYPEPRVAVAV